MNFIRVAFQNDLMYRTTLCIKLCQKFGHLLCSETIHMIRKVYSDDSMSDTRIKELFRRFKSDPRFGRLIMVETPENVKRVRVLIN